MASQGRMIRLNLDQAQERELLQDLLDISKDREFGNQYQVALAEPERYDRLVIRISLLERQNVKLVVSFRSYPAMRAPEIEFESRGDERSRFVIKVVSESLSSWGRLIKIQDIVAAAREAVDMLSRSESQSKRIRIEDDDSESARRKVRVGKETYPQEPTAHGPVQKDRDQESRPGIPRIEEDLGNDLLKIVRAIADAIFVREKEFASDSTLKNHGRRDKTIVMHEDDYVVSTVVRKLFIPEILVERILRDFSKHSPNEYAFMCSGVLTPEGTVFVTDYYPGEMSVSSPGYCELKDEFIEKTIYDHIPRSHNLIVWGHVHPIEGPSGTDSGSFHELAEWDKKVAKIGMISKRSIGMLINGNNYRISFYDAHSRERLRHSLIARGESTPYDRLNTDT